MNRKHNFYLLDAGNTQVKLASCQGVEIKSITRFALNNFPWSSLNGNIPCIVSSVLNDDFRNRLETFFSEIISIHPNMQLPFQMDYQTPDTLGIDRLCNMAAVAKKNKGVSKLVVDLGTCIKFDYMNEENVYQGGSIAPGLEMRASALKAFTARLPYFPVNHRSKLIGKTTQESMESGVFNGWKAEIEKMILTYRELFPGIQVFLTGGDLRHFDFDQKMNIFVLEDLTLEGILEIYRLNEDSF